MIQRLGYIPNQIAQGLRSKKTNTVALIIPSLGECLLLWEIQFILRTACVKKVIRWLYVRIIGIATDQVDYLISFFITRWMGLLRWMFFCRKRFFLILKKIPVVCVDGIYPRLATDLVSSTNFQGAFEAGEHLSEQDIRGLALIAGPRNSYTTMERTRGFLAALHQAGINVRSEYCLFGDDTAATASELVCQVLSLPEPPTALFFLNYASFLAGFMENPAAEYSDSPGSFRDRF